MLDIGLWLAVIATLKFRFIFLFYVKFNSQGHIVTGSLQVEEPVHTSWSIFCTVNHRASASNYQLSNNRAEIRSFEPATSEVECFCSSSL